MGYLSKVETGFTVCFKSPHRQTLVLSGFRTPTMGVAHPADSTGSKVPPAIKWLNCISILSCKKYGIVRTLQYLGGAAGSIIILALQPVRVPKPS